MLKERKKISLLSKIETAEDALRIIKEASIAFMVIGVIQGVISIVFKLNMIIDAAALLVLGTVLYAWKSRIAAVLLLMLLSAGTVAAIMNKISTDPKGGTNVFLAIILLVTAARAVEAVFRLKRKLKED